jgi:4-hydroxy-4-methyl-2-oxoglutarate aldolase
MPQSRALGERPGRARGPGAAPVRSAVPAAAARRQRRGGSGAHTGAHPYPLTARPLLRYAGDDPATPFARRGKGDALDRERTATRAPRPLAATMGSAPSRWNAVPFAAGLSVSELDPTLRQARERLTSAVLSDTLDALGLIHQTMEHNLRPLDEALVLCGRAHTATFGEVAAAGHEGDVYEPLADIVDSLRPDEVIVLACGRSSHVQVWGDLVSTAALARGAAGCVTDGMVRDVRNIRRLGFPVFSGGRSPIGTRGRTAWITRDTPVHCGGVWVSPGDLIFGDVDGIVVIPRAAEADVLRRAAEQADLEREIVRSLRDGARIVDIYRRFGTL